MCNKAEKICKKLNIELTPHGLRRSYKTLAIWAKINEGSLAQISGHKPSALVERHYIVRPIVNTSKNQYNTDMSYPIHFRKKILAKLEEGQSIRAVAQHFEINKNTILSWKKRIEIKRTRPRKPSKIDDDALRADVEKYPDDYQYERAARFGCGVSSIGDALKRLKITVKKRPYVIPKPKQNCENDT